MAAAYDIGGIGVSNSHDAQGSARDDVQPAGFIDIHHHILWGVDDGPRTQADSEAMLALAYAEGTRRIIATSHFDPLGVCPDVGKLMVKLDTLNALCAQRFPGLSIALGAEILFNEGIRRKLRAGIIPTLAGSDHVLVEFLPTVTASELEKAVRHLANGGFVTIVAHVERYGAIVKAPDTIRHLKGKYGARIQMNAETLIGKRGFFLRRYLKHAIAEGLIDFIASDAHGAQRRRSRLKEGEAFIERRYGTKVARKLFYSSASVLFPLC